MVTLFCAVILSAAPPTVEEPASPEVRVSEAAWVVSWNTPRGRVSQPEAQTCAQVASHLEALRSAGHKGTQLLLRARPNILYRRIIETMDCVRGTFPDITFATDETK